LLASNFNALTTRGDGYWASMEPTKGSVSLSGINTVSDFATAHGMHTRFHNVIWDITQPSWVNTLRSSGSKTSLSAAITSRLNYILNDSHSHFAQMDVYNEQAGSSASDSYNTIYGQSGIAGIYNQAAALAPNTQMFVNGEFGNGSVLNGTDPDYIPNVKALVAAGGNVGGLGIEDYNAGTSVTPSLFMQNIQSLNVLGIPEEITEYGSHTPSNVATTLNQALRMMFGNPNSEGFIMWEWMVDPNGYATDAGLYDQSLQLTPAGQVWQGLVLNTWRTPSQTLIADSNGQIHFNGYYGDYLLNGQPVTFSKSVGLPGDFNHDGRVDAADYTVWRDSNGTGANYNLWKANFGTSSGSAVPEPPTWLLMATGLMLLVVVVRLSIKRWEQR
jgi:hypothetical protein